MPEPPSYRGKPILGFSPEEDPPTWRDQAAWRIAGHLMEKFGVKATQDDLKKVAIMSYALADMLFKARRA